MGLTLVTGPANAAKAQIVLDACRAASARGPILVVPRSADVEHYRRDLARQPGEGPDGRAEHVACLRELATLVAELEARRAISRSRPPNETTDGPSTDGPAASSRR